MYDEEAYNGDTFESKLNRYHSSPEVYSGKEDILNGWFHRKLQYPHLSVAAKKLFCIHVSSTSTERTFTKAHLLITDQRRNLNADTVSG